MGNRQQPLNNFGEIKMSWKEYLKSISKEDITDWETALKAFTEKGKELGIPLSVIELLKKAVDESE